MSVTASMRGYARGMLVAAAMLAPMVVRAAEPTPAERCEAEAKRPFLGFVLAVSGSSTAESPICGKEPRLLVCGELLFAGDRVRTEDGARVDVLVQGVRVHVDGGSELRIGLTKAGAPDVTLLQGRVRLVDSRTDAGAVPYRLATPDLVTVLRGADSEALINATTAGPASSVCARGQAIEVTRLGGVERTAATPGECVVAKPDLALYASQPREPLPLLADIGQCNLIGDARQRFDPNDVASGPVAFQPGPPGQSDPSQEPCTVSPCPPIVGPDVQPPIVVQPAPVVESPPVFKPPPGVPVRPPPKP